jgi:PAS domain-containing protein
MYKLKISNRWMAMSRSGFSSIRELSFPPGETVSAKVPAAREALRKTFALMDVNGVIVYIDPVMAMRFGDDPQSFSGKHISTLIPGERIGALVRRVVKTGIPQKLSGAMLSSWPGSGTGLNDHYLLPITADSGKVTGVVFCRVARPVSDPAPVPDRVEKKFKTLFDSISIPILIVQESGSVLECNRAACEYLGIGGNDLSGMTLPGLTRAGWAPRIEAGIDEALRNGRSRF